jgi:pimeloyl-ACP methyl ester carboxylesterase
MTPMPADDTARSVEGPEASGVSGSVPFRGGVTWYRVAGSRSSGPGQVQTIGSADDAAPLVLLHGGPGAGHNYLLPLIELFGEDRAIVFYDQVGCGNSTPRPDWPDESFTMDLFLQELESLVVHLGLNRFHLLGHSWGGMLATEYALAHPGKIASLTLCSTAASVKLMMGSLLPLYAAVEAEGVPPEQFMEAFCARHICRITPLPDGLAQSLSLLAKNPQVNRAMNTSDETGEIVGTLRGWTSEDRLTQISAPTLVMHGEFDEQDASAHEPFLKLIPDVRGHVFAGASHSAYSESPEEFREVLAPFLAANDSA